MSFSCYFHVLFWLCISWSSKLGVGSKCPGTSLVTYEFNLQTLWHRKDFPKNYPQWRPPASWSKTLGFSHDATFRAYEEGVLASDALKQFLKTTKDELFDLHTQGKDGIMDRFVLPRMLTGVGEENLTFSLDGNHSKVSILSKLIPSPDWFIGLDSYDMCPNGTWLSYVSLEARPIDGGTDNGLTFSSPEWPTSPQEKIRPITSKFPSHPAGSFNYPELDYLPPIAQFTLKKKKEYVLRSSSGPTDSTYVNPDKKDVYENFQKTDPLDSKTQMDDSSVNIFKEPEIDRSKFLQQNHIPLKGRLTTKKNYNFKAVINNPLDHNSYKNIVYTKKSLEPVKPTFAKEMDGKFVTEPGIHDKKPILNSVLTSRELILQIPKNENKHKVYNRTRNSPPVDTKSVLDDIVKEYQKEQRKKRRKRRKHLRKYKPPRDCKVSDWSSWSACSKTCGIGEHARTRTVLKHARRGGKPCPSLTQTTWCGSAKRCKRTDYFNWNS